MPKARPQMVLANKMLQFSSLELERAISQELAENPALELVEGGRCEVCGAVFSGQDCPLCTWAEERRSLDRGREEWAPSSMDEEWDPLAQLASTPSLSEHLFEQMAPRLDPDDRALARYLIESLDEHGLLTTDLEELEGLTGAPGSKIEEIVALLQEQEPVGIGAKSVQECLLIQLRDLEEQGVEQPLAERLLREHWEELGKRQFHRIAEALGVPEEEVEKALEFIAQNLNPYPAQAYRPTESPPYIRPDVIIRFREEEFDIEIPEEERYRFQVHPLYRELLNSRAASEEEKEHLREYIARARLFMASFQQRWGTLRRIVAGLVEEQEGFLRLGASHIKPLTRAQLAHSLGLHESTVSRAMAQKYAQTPQGRLLPLADFFDASLRAKEWIGEMVSGEDHPLSDGEIAEELARRGLPLARRTVAKYRQALGILPARLRGKKKAV